MTTPLRIFDLLTWQKMYTPSLKIFNSFDNGSWNGISTTAFIERVNDLSIGLLKKGVKPGDKVAIISENRLEWNLFDFAIQQMGAVVVPIYPTI